MSPPTQDANVDICTSDLLAINQKFSQSLFGFDEFMRMAQRTQENPFTHQITDLLQRRLKDTNQQPEEVSVHVELGAR